MELQRINKSLRKEKGLVTMKLKGKKKYLDIFENDKDEE